MSQGSISRWTPKPTNAATIKTGTSQDHSRRPSRCRYGTAVVPPSRRMARRTIASSAGTKTSRIAASKAVIGGNRPLLRAVQVARTRP
jgi:hypothetical protein